MKIRKAIGYCYPSSPTATLLGSEGYFIKQWLLKEDGNWSGPYIEQGHDIFDSVNDPDLWELLNEADGEHYKKWCHSK